MAGVRLEFAQFGHFDHFNIYRNTVSTEIENLGQPIGTSTTMYYEDFTVEPKQDYYYRIGVFRDSVEEFSEELYLRTELAQDRIHRVQLKVTSANVLDNYGTIPLTWSQSGITLLHENNEIQYTSTTSYLKSNEAFNWAGVWDVEFYVYIDSTVSNSYKSIVSNKYNEWVLGGMMIYYADNGSADYELSRFGIGNYGANGLMSNVMTKDTWHHVRCIKTADHKYTMYVDDVLQYENATTNISDRNPSDGIINIGNITSGISGAGIKVRNFIIH